MKSNLKEQVAELQKDLNHQFKRIETLTDSIDNYLVPRLQKLDKELIDLKNQFERDDTLSRVGELEKRVEDLHIRLNLLTIRAGGRTTTRLQQLEQRVKHLEDDSK